MLDIDAQPGRERGEESTMRFYVFTPGSPGYISSEHAIRELPEGPDEARAWAEDHCHIDGTRRLISRSEALMVPLYRDALERWERRDDAVLQGTEATAVLEDRRQEATLHAAHGCRVAAAALEADDDERISAFCFGHSGCCEPMDCGGRRDPWRPRQRPLHAV